MRAVVVLVEVCVLSVSVPVLVGFVGAEVLDLDLYLEDEVDLDVDAREHCS